MSVKVHVVQHRVMAGEHKGEYLYYGRLKARDKVPFQQFCRRVMEQSSGTPGDVDLVLNSLLTLIRDHLAMGNVVQLGQMGNMRICVGSQGVEKPDDFHVTMMKRPRIIFTPGSRLREMVSQVKFEHRDTITEIQTVYQQQPPPDLGDDD